MRSVIIAALVACSGCGYISVLRRQSVDLTRRRQAVIAVEAEVITEAIDLTNLTDLDEAEAVELVAAVLESAAKIKTAAVKSDAWLAPMETDLRSVPEEQQIELNSDAELDALTSYNGLSDSKAFTQRWLRAAISAPGRIRRGLSRAYRAVKWSLIVGVLALAAFGLWSWRRGRSWHRATREAEDVISAANELDGFDVRAATAGKPALRAAWERDRAWRAKRRR